MTHSVWCNLQPQSYKITGLPPHQLIVVTITATNDGGSTSYSSQSLTAMTNEAG